MKVYILMLDVSGYDRSLVGVYATLEAATAASSEKERVNGIVHTIPRSWNGPFLFLSRNQEQHPTWYQESGRLDYQYVVEEWEVVPTTPASHSEAP